MNRTASGIGMSQNFCKRKVKYASYETKMLADCPASIFAFAEIIVTESSFSGV